MTRSVTGLGLVVAAASLLGAAAGASAPAGDRSIWQGKYGEGERANFAYVAGDEWIEVKRDAGGTVRVPYREVTRTPDFIELQMSGKPQYRIRILSDRIEYRSTLGGDRWTEIATGRWTE